MILLCQKVTFSSKRMDGCQLCMLHVFLFSGVLVVVGVGNVCYDPEGTTINGNVSWFSTVRITISRTTKGMGTGKRFERCE